jgi:hypothetical protein
MTALPVSAPPRASATIRPLSGYERLFLAVDIVNGFNFAIAVTFSNLKTAEFPVEPDGLRVESVWGPSVLLGVEGEQMIGSVTFGGALHLVYSSFTPLPGLLEAVSETIVNACCTS